MQITARKYELCYDVSPDHPTMTETRGYHLTGIQALCTVQSCALCMNMNGDTTTPQVHGDAHEGHNQTRTNKSKKRLTTWPERMTYVKRMCPMYLRLQLLRLTHGVNHVLKSTLS